MHLTNNLQKFKGTQIAGTLVLGSHNSTFPYLLLFPFPFPDPSLAPVLAPSDRAAAAGGSVAAAAGVAAASVAGAAAAADAVAGD